MLVSLGTTAVVVAHHAHVAPVDVADDLAGELADVALYLLQLASVARIDLEAAVLAKLKANYDRTW